MTKPYILILDQHNSDTTAVLFDKRGYPSARATQHISYQNPKPFWKEMDPMERIYSMRSTIAKVFQRCKADPKEVEAIGVVTNATDTFIWNKDNGEPLHPGVSIHSKRNQDFFDGLAQSQLDSYVKEKTGLSLSPYTPAVQWNWMIREIPEVKSAVQRGKAILGTLDSWLVYNLTGGQSHISDLTHAGSTSVLDIRSLEWDPFLLEEFKIPRDGLPQTVKSSGFFGLTKGFVTLPDGIPILGVANAAASEMVGMNGLKYGECKVAYGGSRGAFLINTGTQLTMADKLLNSVIISFPKDIRFGLERTLSFPQGFDNLLLNEEAFYSPSPVFGQMAEEAKDSGGVYIVTRQSQTEESEAQSAIFGISSKTTKSQIIRAFYESIAFSVKKFFDDLDKATGLYPKELKVNGNLSQHDFLLQFQADILQVPVVRMKVDTPRHLGVAYLAGAVSGMMTPEKGMSQMAKIDKQFVPSLDPISSVAKFNQWKDVLEKW